MLHGCRRVARCDTVSSLHQGHQPPCFRREMAGVGSLSPYIRGDLSQGWLTERQGVGLQPRTDLRHGQEEAAEEIFELPARCRANAGGFHHTARWQTELLFGFLHQCEACNWV